MPTDWRDMTASDFDASIPLTLFDLSWLTVADVPARPGLSGTPDLFCTEEE